MLFLKNTSRIQSIDPELLELKSHQLSVLREDELHSFVSGNKFRKLKYNLQEAKLQKKKTLLTFGGAYSNHIAAVASAGQIMGFTTIGVIRGEELASNFDKNSTLRFATQCGMQLHFVTRAYYKEKEEPHVLKELENHFGDFYLLPEGGTNALAVKGCQEILSEATKKYDYICTSVGTGGTLAGLVIASEAHQNILGFSALKGDFQLSEVKKYTSKTNVELLDTYSFGGYGKIDSNLVRFMNDFKMKTQIPLDPIYTAKLFYGIMDKITNGQFKENSRILAIHTGGLQGIEGMNQLLKKKNLPQID